jgi:phosphotransferase system HPr (HPr) family protein
MHFGPGTIPPGLREVPPLPEAPRRRSFEEDMIMAALPIARRRIELGEAHGLHLRPAARFVEVARRYAADVRVRCSGSEADGKSVLDLISLAAGIGMVLELEARGPGAGEAVIALADLISARPHEIEESRVA